MNTFDVQANVSWGCETNCVFSNIHSTQINPRLKALFFWDETQKVCPMHHAHMLETWHRDARGRFMWGNRITDKEVRSRRNMKVTP